MSGTSQQTCLAPTSTDSKLNDGTWSCSSAYNDRVYAKHVCQYNNVACGTVNNTIVLADTTSTQSVNITGLTIGQTCFYKVQAACGGPSFKPNDTSKVEIEYVEFRGSDLSNDTVRALGLGSSNQLQRNSTPAANMPRRDHFFNMELGGNQIANANSTNYNASVNGTIFGRSGRYDEFGTGRKAYGNPTQGDSQMANLTDQSLPNCTTRNLYVAVTAVVDQASLKVDFSSVAFYRPPAVTSTDNTNTNTTSDTTGANILSITFAAVLGLISLAFF